MSDRLYFQLPLIEIKPAVSSIAIGLLLLTLSLFNATSFAQEDEVIRIEDLSRHELNTYIIEAEDQLYELFNTLNSTDRFDIVCRKDVRTGSNIPVRICQPKFLNDNSSDNVSDFMFGGRALAADSAVISNAKDELQKLQDEMASLVGSNAQMRDIASILQLMRKRREQL